MVQFVTDKDHLLLVFGELPVTFESCLDIAVGVKEVQHQLQRVPVHIHVQPVLVIRQVDHRANILKIKHHKG